MKTAMRPYFGKTSLLAAAFGLLALAAQPAAAQERAKDLFGAEKLPTTTAPQSFGFYPRAALPAASPFPWTDRPGR